MRIGYTDKQAEAAHTRVDRATAKAADSLAALMRAIPDTGVNVAYLQEEVEAIGHGLHDTIERRRCRHRRGVARD